MNRTVYIQTSIVSYLTSRVSRNLIAAARQQARLSYDLYISEVVSLECAAGDPDAAQKRLDAIEGLRLLRTTKEAVELSKAIVERGIIPVKAAEDSLHISIATIHAMDFLLTWNCRHIANPEMQRQIALYLEEQGLFLPFICTPEQLLGADDE